MHTKRTPSMFVAVYLLLLSEERVLMLRRHKTGYEDGNYSIIAGHVEQDERVTHALVREAAEEVGIQIETSELQFVYVMQGQGVDGSVYLDFFFIAEHWKGQVQNGEPAKCDDLQWFPLAALPTNAIPHVREVLGMFHNRGRGFSEYAWGD
jgi:8-oxo-dGTP diphosphatase